MKVNHRLLRSRRKVCQYKVKLDLVDAPEYLLAAQKDTTRYRDPENLELYLCPSCGYLHIGHKIGSKDANPVHARS